MPIVPFDPSITRLRQIEKLVAGLIEDTEGSAIALQPEGLRQAYQLKSPDMRSVGLLMQSWRELREQMFPVTKLGEAGWDILLALHIAYQEGHSQVSTKVAISRACVPSTTGLRWLALLEGHGAIRRTAAAHDQRLKMVELNPSTYAKIEEYLHGFSAAMMSLCADGLHPEKSNVAYFKPQRFPDLPRKSGSPRRSA